ncbi:extracellular alpha-1 4-glucan glucosidase [Fusarium sp. NRRL 52700]|nr:extracellular alpha-1 4-glucan glucosidase [Fusarium sp. NRRL 52700]
MSGNGFSTSDSSASSTEQACWDACANSVRCVAANWDGGMSSCSLFDSITSTASSPGSASDIAIVQSQSSSSTSASSTTSSASTTTSAAAGGCSDGLVASGGAQLLVACGYTVTSGTAYNTPSSANEAECWSACANDANCYGAVWDNSMIFCELYSSITVTASNINHDVALMYSRPSLTSTSAMSSTTSSASTTTSAASGGCQSGPYTSGNNVVLSVQCTKSWIGTDYSYPNVQTENSCWDACANDVQCVGVEWNGSFRDCTLFSQVSSTASGMSGQDIALVQSRPSLTTSSAPATSSSAAPGCQAGTYTSSNNVVFSIQCGQMAYGTYTSTSGLSGMQACWDACANDVNCQGSSWIDSAGRCDIYTIFHTTNNSPGNAVAVVQSRASSTSTSSPSSTTSSASATSSSAACQDGFYTSTNNIQFSVACGKKLIGSYSVMTRGPQSLQQCMDNCVANSPCYGITWDGSACYLYSQNMIGGFTAAAGNDAAIMASSSSSSSTSSTTSSAPAATSSAPACQAGSYTGPNNVQFTVTCDSSINGSPVTSSGGPTNLQQCPQAGFAAAIVQASTSSSSSSSSTSSSAAATSSAAPLCQAGTYTSSTNNVQFNTACERKYTGTLITSAVALDFQNCMDMCASDSSCVALSLEYSVNGNTCNLFSYTSYSGPDASWDLAVVSLRPSSSSSSSTSSTSSTSSSAAATTSAAPGCTTGTQMATNNVFEVYCNSGITTYTTLSSLGAGYTDQTCLQACDANAGATRIIIISIYNIIHIFSRLNLVGASNILDISCSNLPSWYLRWHDQSVCSYM